MPAKKKSPTARKTTVRFVQPPKARVLGSWTIETDQATVAGLQSHARRLGVSFEFLVATALRAWKGALSEEKNCGLTFPVRIETKCPGDCP